MITSADAAVAAVAPESLVLISFRFRPSDEELDVPKNRASSSSCLRELILIVGCRYIFLSMDVDRRHLRSPIPDTAAVSPIDPVSRNEKVTVPSVVNWQESGRRQISGDQGDKTQ